MASKFWLLEWLSRHSVLGVHCTLRHFQTALYIFGIYYVIPLPALFHTTTLFVRTDRLRGGKNQILFLPKIIKRSNII